MRSGFTPGRENAPSPRPGTPRRLGCGPGFAQGPPGPRSAFLHRWVFSVTVCVCFMVGNRPFLHIYFSLMCLCPFPLVFGVRLLWKDGLKLGEGTGPAAAAARPWCTSTAPPPP